MTKWRTQIRRQMNDRDIVTRGIHTDCLLNYETVKYFGGEEHEGQRYREAVANYQVLEYRVMRELALSCALLSRKLIHGVSLSQSSQLGSELHYSESCIQPHR